MLSQECGSLGTVGIYPKEVVVPTGQLVRAGSGADHQHLVLVHHGHHCHGHRAGHVPDDRRHPLYYELCVGLNRSNGILGVVLHYQLNWSAMDSTLAVFFLHGQDDAVPSGDTQVGYTPGKTADKTDHNRLFCRA